VRACETWSGVERRGVERERDDCGKTRERKGAITGRVYRHGMHGETY